MKKWTQNLLLSLICIVSSPAYANEWFTVEVIVFANQGSENLDNEYWADISEIPARSAITLKPTTAGELDEFQILPASLLSLNSEKNRIKASSKYRVMYHAGWMQSVPETQNPKPIRIQGGEILDNGMYELDGYIAVGRGRYLHFRPDLYFSRSLTPTESNLLPVKSDAQTMRTTISGAIPSAGLYIPEILTVNLNQARRMRSKELHFIDHPLFGILVEMTPVE